LDTFAPISRVAEREAVGDPHALEMSLKVNGVMKQRAFTSQMVHKVEDVLAHLAARMTLEPGDIVATGTPEGVPRIVPGDVLEAEIERVGRLMVRVRAAR
jgi:2-keto-4-pentenoate hydratase/2-oxohepta-3-ene-1,7-dioic acid hydratase in catechol pathway